MNSTSQAKRLKVTASPHITSGVSTRGIMVMVCCALLPTLVASSLIFGPRVLLLTGVTVATCVGFESLYCLLLKKPQTVGDFSAVVTGMILAFNLPPLMPLWMACIGSFVAIVIVKQLFGGIGFNFANPALVGRMVLQISFTGYMIQYVAPQTAAVTTATPLLTGASTYTELLLGTHAGVLGETCALTLLIGGIFLVVVKVISPVVPATFIGGTFVFKLLLSLAGGTGIGGAFHSGLYSILSGGLLLGAIFMATDYTTCPYTLKGRLIYGLGLAVLTTALREWSNMNEGVSNALLIMNLLVPYINNTCRQKPLGAKKAKKAEKKA